jgi:hypothetical protein
MTDDFEVTFVVEIAPDKVWQVLSERVSKQSRGKDKDKKHYVLPGFPAFGDGADGSGALCTMIEEEPGHLLRVRKAVEPCAGSEIAIRLEKAGEGTRVTVVQSEFGTFLDIVGRDTVFGHGNQIVNDFRLFLERGLFVPGTVWGPGLDATLTDRGIGLELSKIGVGGFAECAGMVAGDLLLTLGEIRIHDLQQLWTVLALTESGSELDVTWARERESFTGKATLGG